MVLAAGLGTRLRPLTDLLPKPAVPVAGLPLVRFALARLRAAGARRVVVNAHHLAADMERVAAGGGAGGGRRARRLPGARHRRDRRGAARGPRRSSPGPAPSSSGTATSSSTWTSPPSWPRTGRAARSPPWCSRPCRRARATPPWTWTGRWRSAASPASGPGGEALVPLHFTGVHVLSPALLDHVPDAALRLRREPAASTRRCSPRGASARWWRAATGTTSGTPARYLQANLDLLSGAATGGRSRAPTRSPRCEAGPAGSSSRRAPRWTRRRALVGPVLVAAGAVVEAGAGVGPGAVLGAGSRVGRGAAVERAVVWPGTAIAPGRAALRVRSPRARSGSRRRGSELHDLAPGPR